MEAWQKAVRHLFHPGNIDSCCLLGSQLQKNCTLIAKHLNSRPDY
jgi:hypothetical protein